MKQIGGFENINFQLSISFMVIQATYISIVVLFLLAMDSVPGFIAVAAVLGVLGNFIGSFIYVSAKKTAQSMTRVKLSAEI